MVINTQIHKKKKKKNVRACSMFYPYERDRSVTPLDAARVNRTIFHTIIKELPVIRVFFFNAHGLLQE